MTGETHLSLEYDPGSDKLGGGAYVVDVRLLDAGGSELDRIVRDFQLGRVEVETTLLEADTARIQPGKPIALHMAYMNRGLATSGKAVIEVYDAQGAPVATFQKDLALLPVDAEGTFDAVLHGIDRLGRGDHFLGRLGRGGAARTRGPSRSCWIASPARTWTRTRCSTP